MYLGTVDAVVIKKVYLTNILIPGRQSVVMRTLDLQSNMRYLEINNHIGQVVLKVLTAIISYLFWENPLIYGLFPIL